MSAVEYSMFWIFSQCSAKKVWRGSTRKFTTYRHLNPLRKCSNLSKEFTYATLHVKICWKYWRQCETQQILDIFGHFEQLHASLWKKNVDVCICWNIQICKRNFLLHGEETFCIKNLKIMKTSFYALKSSFFFRFYRSAVIRTLFKTKEYCSTWFTLQTVRIFLQLSNHV